MPSVKNIFINHLTFNELQDMLFSALDRTVLADETGHVATRNRRFHGADMRIRNTEEMAAVIS